MSQNYRGLSDLKSRVHRSGQDIGRKVSFSAKTGEILPIYWDLASPNDSYNIRIQHFTRTIPVNTAAYTRIREFVDVYEVPLRQLWRNVDNVMLDIEKVNPTYSVQPFNPVLPSNTKFPYLTTKGLSELIALLANYKSGNHYMFDSGGMSRAFTTFKLLHYLRYGRIFPSSTKDEVSWDKIPESSASLPNAQFLEYRFGFNVYPTYTSSFVIPGQSVAENAFPLLAYQKIYSDFYRNTHWEDRYPQTYNVDYLTEGADLLSSFGFTYSESDALTPFGNLFGTYQAPVSSMFDMRYCDFNKDLFFGVHPDSQFGDESFVVMQSNSGGITLNGSISSTSGDIADYTYPGDEFIIYTQKELNGPVGITVPQIRVVSDETKLSQSQISGIEYAGVGGVLGATGESGAGNFALGINTKALAKRLAVSGTASGVSFKSQFSILALRQAEALQRYREVIGSGAYDIVSQVEKMFGYKMPANLSGLSIYRGGYASNIDISEVVNQNITAGNAADIAGKATSTGQDTINFTASDYSCVMVLYHNRPLIDWNTQAPDPQLLCVDGADFPKPAFDNIGMEPVTMLELMGFSSLEPGGEQILPLGYQPRYYAWKTKTDDVLGAFAAGSYAEWVSVVDLPFLWSSLVSGEKAGTVISSPSFFKVTPRVLDSIFSVSAENTFDTDQFLINMNVDVKVVRSLSNDGLEY